MIKTRIQGIALLIALSALLIITGYRCASTRNASDSGQIETIFTNIDGKGIAINLDFQKGKSHNHPLMAIWLEESSGKYIETIYVAESIGKGIFKHGEKSQGQWQAGPVRRPAALPYWGHKRGVQAQDGLFIPTPENPVADAITGPTPAGNFILQSKTTAQAPSIFKILLEINQSWDWNEYWTNTKYPGDENYNTSSQPSVVYEATIDLNSSEGEYVMKPIGHGHYSGSDGSLTADLSTLTTAMEIVKRIAVRLD